MNEPGVYVEQIVDESWTEHLRRVYRVTEGDIVLRERKMAFHLDPEPPQLSRRVVVGI